MRCVGRQAYKLRFDRIAQSTTVFQCVFVLVHPDEEVQRAAAAARRAFGLGDGPGYTPHLSLLYADIPQEERAELVEQLQARARTCLPQRPDHAGAFLSPNLFLIPFPIPEGQGEWEKEIPRVERRQCSRPVITRTRLPASAFPSSAQARACPAAWGPARRLG